MNLRFLAKNLDKLIADSAPAILTAVGVVGTVATGVLSARAHVTATDVVRELENNPATPSLPLSKQDKLVATWKLYLPPISVAAVSCSAIVMSNRISTKRAAALAAAYTVLQNNHEEYVDKAKEMIGVKKEGDIRAAVAQDRINSLPPEGNVFNANGGDVMFMDAFSGRYFKSDMETVKAAINNVNHSIVKGDYASLNNVYAWLGLPSIPPGDEVGWNGDSLIDPSFTTGTTDGGAIPVHVLSFKVAPRRKYDSAYS